MELPKVFEFEGKEWDGEHWAEQLEGDARRQYKMLVEGLMFARTEDIPQICREIFQVGRYMGWCDGLEAATK